jgi:hypothetical protein
MGPLVWQVQPKRYSRNRLLPVRLCLMRHCGMIGIPVKHGASRSTVRPRRDFVAMEQRRMRAADLFEQGIFPPRSHGR